jgi:predicted nuclease of predicted toxin-antitoxin system
MVKFLLGESCDAAVAVALKEAGYDVLMVAHVSPGISDEEVITLALEQRRILLTEDKDFGQLVYASGKEACGVMLFRFPSFEREDMAKRAVELVSAEKESLQTSFVVLEPDKVRIRRKSNE